MKIYTISYNICIKTHTITNIILHHFIHHVKKYIVFFEKNYHLGRSILPFLYLPCYRNFMKLLKFTIPAAFIFVLVSCASRPAVIPDDLSAAELVQRAQEASDKNRYNLSLQYYEAILDRFPYDSEYVCAAEYEIAFIHYKQKKYDISKAGFNALLERYNTPDEELLPPQYKVLAKKILGIINETESKNRNGESV